MYVSAFCFVLIFCVVRLCICVLIIFWFILMIFGLGELRKEKREENPEVCEEEVRSSQGKKYDHIYHVLYEN